MPRKRRRNGIIRAEPLFHFSSGIAAFAVSLAFDSNTKMIQNANVNFLQAAGDFEKARIKYLAPIAPYNLEAFLWRSKHHMYRASELDRKIIKPKNQKILYSYFYVTLWQMFVINNVNWNLIRPDDRMRIIEMYTIAREFVKKPKDEKKVMRVFEICMGKKPNETEEEFYHRLFH